MGPAEAGFERGAAIAARAFATPGDRSASSGLGIDTANGMVFGVDYEQVAVRIASNSLGAIKACFERGSAIAAVALFPAAGKGSDRAVAVDLADAVAFALADVGVSLAINANGSGPDDNRLGSGAAVADV